MKHHFRARYDRWRLETYPRIAPALATLTLVVAVLASVGVVILTRVQGTERARRLASISELQGCFDTYASASSATSKVVRIASADVSEAQTLEAQRSVVWTGLLVEAFAFPQNDTSPEAKALLVKFGRATSQLREAQAELVDAQEALARARKDNPVPDPPSTFCRVQP